MNSSNCKAYFTHQKLFRVSKVASKLVVEELQSVEHDVRKLIVQLEELLLLLRVSEHAEVVFIHLPLSERKCREAKYGALAVLLVDLDSEKAFWLVQAIEGSLLFGQLLDQVLLVLRCLAAFARALLFVFKSTLRSHLRLTSDGKSFLL